MTTRTLVVAGHGMVGHRLVEEMLTHDREGRWRVVVLGEEPRAAYDRVALSSLLDGATPHDLALAGPGVLDDGRLRLRPGTTVTGADRRARSVTCDDGTEIGYDALVLATGSRPFVPPVPGHDLPGCFVYRTVEDVAAIRAAAVPGREAVVVGGGLLGLEAANGLRLLGMRPHVVERAPWLMAQQIDEGGGRVLAGAVERLGVGVHCSSALHAVGAGAGGRTDRVELADGTVLDAALVVFAAGVRPRDELAAPLGLERGERGGFLVDEWCRTADEHIWAIGECAAVEGRCHGLVAPGFRMAETVARQLTGGPPEAFAGADASAKLKLLGVEVAGFGDAHARSPGAIAYVREDRRAGTYAKVVLAADGRTVLGGVLAGDTRAYPVLRGLTGRELTASPDELLTGATGGT
ncbi:FAD-dependent oxidoreductase [Streptomyces sp. NEAU-W12]|uniref:FAD-dependent oxidoreductase n=1 Tax=Streptomyces sp. NEAU-W12 TaxID=2994668 RepID=UPI00224BA1BC|nr:FAD-dependent oxidoreductase [Streptomyces sp. NEAU-W12]MCX2927471.1 FAD-dependent oxidoreductase [Streptomyces sp. NEAU-W12]